MRKNLPHPQSYTVLCARINFAISEVSFGGGHMGPDDGYDLDIHASVLHEGVWNVDLNT